MPAELGPPSRACRLRDPVDDRIRVLPGSDRPNHPGRVLIYNHDQELTSSAKCWISDVRAGASLYLAYISATVTLLLVGLSFAAFSINGALGTYRTVVLDAAPEGARGAFSGITSAIGNIGSVIAPVIIGYLVSETGAFAAGFGFMIAALVAAAACCVTAGRLAARPHPPAGSVGPSLGGRPENQDRTGELASSARSIVSSSRCSFIAAR